MSRTDKDRPYWVRVNDKTEVRTPYHYHHRGRFFFPHYDYEDEECTIDIPATGSRDTWRRNCGYYLGYRRHVCETTNDMVREEYYSPLRNAERMVLRNAVKDYNTFGEVDEDIVLTEKHGRGPYGGGWWD